MRVERAEIRAIAKQTIAEVKNDDISALAGGVAFKLFLSLFPSLIAAVAIYGLVAEPTTLNQLFDTPLGRVLPDALVAPESDDSAGGLLRQELENLTTDGGAAGFAAVIGTLGGLWAATGAATSVMRALNKAYDLGEHRKFLPARLTALGLTGALFVALIALVLLLVAGGPIQQFLLPPALRETVVSGLFTLGRILAAVVVLALLFAFVYWAGPNRARPQWQWLSPGAILGVIGWLLISGGFALYTRVAGNYDATYGALGGVVVVLLWLQLSMLALLAGAELNSVLERRLADGAVRSAGEGFAAALTPVGATAQGVAAPASAVAALRRQPPVVGADEQPLGGLQQARARFAFIAAGATAAVLFLGLARRTRRRP